MSITKARPNRRRRNVNPEINQPELNNPIMITAATAVGSVLTLTFNTVVSLVRNAVPEYTTDVAGPPAPEAISAVLTSPNTVEITFDGAVATATEVRIPFRDPAIRNATGGYVSNSTFPV